jgi:hypothetical protein
VAACLATADENSVLVVLFDTGETTQVSSIGIDRIATGDYLNATLAFGFLVLTGELIRNSTTTLSETYYY